MKKSVFLGLVLMGFFNILRAQCPDNIDFEKGTFDGWTCYTGSVNAAGNTNNISLSPSGGAVFDQHTMYDRSRDDGVLDYFGNFPVLCPNGSNHSIRLGNTGGGAQAEGISYEFTIPAGQNTYSLTYHYAVVFQDPNHQIYEQPRLELEVTNVTDNQLIECSSFTFIPNGSGLPGFFQSPNTAGNATTVWCKDWTPVSINLNNKAGKTIRLFFKTADCTFRVHFGYAYIDVNSGCSNDFTGAAYCPDDTAVNVVGPYGFESYTWYNSSFTAILGQSQILHLSPPPLPGTTLAVAVVPFAGYGCPDTLYAHMADTLKLKADAGLDQLSCNGDRVLIGSIPQPGVTYAWSPTVGLSNPGLANPRASPITTTEYELTITSTGGGCLEKDTVVVRASKVDTTMQLLGKSLFCIGKGDSAVLVVNPSTTIQWVLNNNQIPGGDQPRYHVQQSGNYFATITNSDGCKLNTRTEAIKIESPRPGIMYPLQYAIMNIPTQLNARTFGSSVAWTPALWLNNPAITNPLFTSSLIGDQFYTIEITTEAGCTTVDSQLVKVIKEVQVYVPTAFTPDNNGLNDYFKPIMIGVKDVLYFRVYHRLGQVVYDYNSGDQRGWDGKIGGQLQTTGVYVWIFRGMGWDNKIHERKGTLTLIR